MLIRPSAAATRRFAAAAAFTVGVLQLVVFAIAEAGLASPALDDVPQSLSGGAAAAARWVSAGGWSLPWFVGAVLLMRAELRRGVAVIATIGALGVVGTAPSFAQGRPGALAVSIPVMAALAVLTAVLAARGRGRAASRDPDHRAGADADGRIGERHPAHPPSLLGTGWYVAAAVLAWLPSVFASTAFAPPGAPRRFLELPGGDDAGLLAALVAGAVAVLILWLAPRLRPGTGGVVASTYALPTLAAEVPAALAVLRIPDVIFTPSGVLGPVGLSAVALIGVVDHRRGRAAGVDD